METTAPAERLQTELRPAPEKLRCREFHFTFIPEKDETLATLIARIARTLQEHQAVVARHFVYGSIAVHDEMLRALRHEFGTVDWPITWVEGSSGNAHPIAGIQIHAIVGVTVRLLAHRNRIVGRVFDDGAARHCVLGDIGPTHLSIAAPEQARETFENLEAALDLAGMSMKNVARTWLFFDDILSWYDPFNKVRNDFFARSQLRPSPNSFPASTGVGGKNPHGAAMVMGAWAIQPHTSFATVCAVPSPLQCSAPAYGSAFARAMEINSSHTRQLLISGTASIAPGGETIHIGDTTRQIDLTMEVVAAILKSRDLSFTDTTRATAYFRHATDMPLFAAWQRQHGQQALPVISTRCDVCRDDLLFEIELDAISD